MTNAHPRLTRAALSFLLVALVGMFIPSTVTVPVGDADVTVAGPTVVCAQEIECFDEEGNYVPCPPDPGAPDPGDGPDDDDDEGCGFFDHVRGAWACGRCVASGFTNVGACLACAAYAARCF